MTRDKLQVNPEEHHLERRNAVSCTENCPKGKTVLEPEDMELSEGRVQEEGY